MNDDLLNIMRQLFGPGVVVRVRKRRAKRATKRAPRAARVRYRDYKESARELVCRKLVEWNAHFGFTYGRVTIRDQRSRWGSCSKKGNLNFNYRLALLPEHLVDYVIVHELCHIAEFNHSPHFWALVARVIPDHHERKRELRKISLRSK